MQYSHLHESDPLGQESDKTERGLKGDGDGTEIILLLEIDGFVPLKCYVW